MKPYIAKDKSAHGELLEIMCDKLAAMDVAALWDDPLAFAVALQAAVEVEEIAHSVVDEEGTLGVVYEYPNYHYEYED